MRSFPPFKKVLASAPSPGFMGEGLYSDSQQSGKENSPAKEQLAGWQAAVATEFGPWQFAVPALVTGLTDSNVQLRLTPDQVSAGIGDADLDALFTIDDSFHLRLISPKQALTVTGCLERKQWDRLGINLDFEATTDDLQALSDFYLQHLPEPQPSPLDRSFAIFGQSQPMAPHDTDAAASSGHSVDIKLWDL